ncbi:hypothetical protein CEN45_10475 [Fischerella thermalis CCMEE 5198]|jgi:hypothetical protein|uniref:hypothetical protein n=1 Tax=Fischerella thermalis TaxID=372787 RepID=UPI000C801796|nr:hypothetical protein [Fischerella thermalis]PLZ90520.1 hypothetical protein CI594_18745 [Fischerella thermalis CCMEE 5196]PMB23419.1 hypothetical protein CEN45_10475 [Fischerella thermalis CCMEE 5198]PMB50453.1 hypothetical protein CEN39_18650 [Fischerella thermalis CCMEE 5201]
MKSHLLKIPFALILVSVSLSQAAYTQTPISKTSKLSQEVAVMRQQGPKGLEAFLKSHANELNSSPEIRQALDKLCQQRDCYASKLYWYTDLEQAKAAAKASGKPILSLRLLGNLDTDLSCANSRFFRVALYPNAEISQKLREDFILHWQSVRPVPKVTIDFGDGRKLERTITGNSIHYILDSSGRPIDAIPGLYGPKAFLRQLQQAEVATKQYSKLGKSQQEAFLQKYHRDRLNSIQTQWTADLSKLGIQSPPRLVELPSNSSEPPNATVAGSLAVTKMRVESPLLNTLQPGQNNPSEITDQATWNRIARLYTSDAKLDQNSIALIRSKKFQSANPQKDGLARLVSNFETAIALDTVRNEYMLHRQIHQWFVQGNQTSNLDALNEKVYAELFLTPSSDPWLGLAPDDVYSAIDNDGVK